MRLILIPLVVVAMVGMALGIWWLLWQGYAWLIVGKFGGPVLTYWEFVLALIIIKAIFGIGRQCAK